MEEKIITIASYPYSRAQLLKGRLEAEGIECFLSNINLVQPDISTGVKVKINEPDAERAYKIIDEIKDEYGKDKDNEYSIKNYNLFFLINKQFPIKTKLLLNIELGLQYNYVNKNSLPIRARGYFYSQADSLAIEYFRFEIYHNNDKTDYLSLKGNINLKYRLTKKHNISAGINFNYCPDYIAKGYYLFYNLPWESYGTAKLGMNYIGLQIGYGFSF